MGKHFKMLHVYLQEISELPYMTTVKFASFNSNRHHYIDIDELMPFLMAYKFLWLFWYRKSRLMEITCVNEIFLPIFFSTAFLKSIILFLLFLCSFYDEKALFDVKPLVLFTRLLYFEVEGNSKCWRTLGLGCTF